jgi:cytochrome c oxidase subunit II
MPPQPTLNDLQIAAVISYERNSWGNNYGFCMPEDVKSAR